MTAPGLTIDNPQNDTYTNNTYMNVTWTTTGAGIDGSDQWNRTQIYNFTTSSLSDWRNVSNSTDLANYTISYWR